MLWAAVVLNLVLLGAYVFVAYQVGFNSDSATKNLMAEEIRRSGSLFPPGFYFSRDLWILNGHLVILLVAPFVGYGFLAHAVNGAVLSVLLLVGLWRLLLYLEISRAIRALVLLACSTGSRSSGRRRSAQRISLSENSTRSGPGWSSPAAWWPCWRA